MRHKIEYCSMRILLCYLFLFVVFGGNVIEAAETGGANNQEIVALQEAISDLKEAVKTRDFSSLKSDVPEKKPLSLGSCNSDSRINLSFDEIINKLISASKDAMITINEIPVHLLSITTIETRGWSGGFPYLYFEFKETDDGWRWLSVYDCDKRSSDFRHEQGEEPSGKPPAISWESKDIQKTQRFKTLIKKLKIIISTKQFEILKIYIPDKRTYSWGSCGPGDSGYDELSFEVINRMLLRYSKGARIYFNPDPDFDLKWGVASIETEGWLGEYPFLTFSFDLLKTKNRWVWSGVCYSATPELKITKNGKYEATYFRKPQLPRPGPRTFKDYSALKARIEEIVRFKEFEALKPYAVRKTLVFGECGLNMKGERIIKGKEKPVDDVVNFLNKNASSANQIKSTGLKNKWNYDTEGWSAEYPYVSFWFDEGKQGWKLTGVAYCKTSLMKLSYPNDPRIK